MPTITRTQHICCPCCEDCEEDCGCCEESGGIDAFPDQLTITVTTSGGGGFSGTLNRSASEWNCIADALTCLKDGALEDFQEFEVTNSSFRFSCSGEHGVFILTFQGDHQCDSSAFPPASCSCSPIFFQFTFTMPDDPTCDNPSNCCCDDILTITITE